MSLITCKECKKEVSDTAEKCPHCGAKIPKKLSIIHKIGIGLGVLFVIAMFAGGDKKTPTAAPAPAEEALKVTSVQIAREYEANEAKADSLYKDKLLQVGGTITDITKDFADNTVVMLEGVNQFNGVHGKLAKEEAPKAVNLTKGQKVTLQCRGGGEVIKSPMLKDCTVL
jgi:hypothetical protein